MCDRSRTFARTRRGLGFQILEIDRELPGNVDEYGPGEGMIDRARDRRQGEAAAKHGVARLDAERPQRQKERAPAGAHGRDEAAADSGSEIGLQPRDLAAGFGVLAVAERAIGAQDLDRSRNPLFRDRHRIARWIA